MRRASGMQIHCGLANGGARTHAALHAWPVHVYLAMPRHASSPWVPATGRMPRPPPPATRRPPSFLLRASAALRRLRFRGLLQPALRWQVQHLRSAGRGGGGTRRRARRRRASASGPAAAAATPRPVQAPYRPSTAVGHSRRQRGRGLAPPSPGATSHWRAPCLSSQQQPPLPSKGVHDALAANAWRGEQLLLRALVLEGTVAPTQSQTARRPVAPSGRTHAGAARSRLVPLGQGAAAQPLASASCCCCPALAVHTAPAEAAAEQKQGAGQQPLARCCSLQTPRLSSTSSRQQHSTHWLVPLQTEPTAAALVGVPDWPDAS